MDVHRYRDTGGDEGLQDIFVSHKCWAPALLRFQGRTGPAANTLTVDEAIELKNELEEAIVEARASQT